MNEIQLGELKEANQEIDRLKIQLAESRSELVKAQTTKVQQILPVQTTTNLMTKQVSRASMAPIYG